MGNLLNTLSIKQQELKDMQMAHPQVMEVLLISTPSQTYETIQLRFFF